MDDIESIRDSEILEREVFLLTKPPHSERAKLCLSLVERSGNAILYLAGDGVYNLPSVSLKALPKDRILAYKEDATARGMQVEKKATLLNDFYEHLVIDILLEGNRIYVF